jgi:hypothetical protein
VNFAAPKRYNRMILLLCSLLMLLRIGGVHLHLCFDGHEQPVTLHILDGGAEHPEGTGLGHHIDENVDDGATSIVKSAVAGLNGLPLLIIVFTLFALVPLVMFVRLDRTLPPVFRTLTCLLPPQRGPPLTANT